MANLNQNSQETLSSLINFVAYRIRQDLSGRLRKHGLDVALWPILYCLWDEDGITQAQIGERAGLAGYSTSRGLDRLEAAGLVERRGDPENRRIHRVFLTDAGRNCQGELVPLTEATHQRVLGLLSAEEQRQLFTLMHKIAQVL